MLSINHKFARNEKNNPYCAVVFSFADGIDTTCL